MARDIRAVPWETVIKVLVSSLFVRQQGCPSIKFANRADLVLLKELVEAGKITPVIDGTYPLSESVGVIDHVGEGHARDGRHHRVRGRPLHRCGGHNDRRDN